MKTIKTILFWFAHCTWGILMTLIGAVGALAMLIKGIKPRRHGYSIYFVAGHNWGGVCLGPFFFVSDDCDDIDSKTHEAGHSLFQALPLGPLFPFVVGIPSAIRYYLFNYDTKDQVMAFCSLIIGIPLVVSVIGFAISLAYSFLPTTIICLAIAIYMLCLFTWLYASEINKISAGTGYGYYDIWFERDASKYGMQHYTKNKEILKYE